MTPTANETSARAPRLLWLPLWLFAAAIAVLRVGEPQAAHEWPALLLVLNITFSTLVALFVAYLCARSFLATAELGVLLLGCGVLVWGVTSGIAAAVAWREVHLTIAVHNLGVWIWGLSSLIGALLATRARGEVRAPGPWVAAVYSGGLVAASLASAAALEGWVPVFFVQGVGGTPVRQAVLGSAVAMLAATAALLWRLDRRTPSAFLRWYSAGLALLTIGLIGVWLQTVRGGSLGWVSRAAQYLGGTYLLVAGISAVRAAHGWRISLAEALRASQERYAAFAAATFEGIVETKGGRIAACNEQFAQMAGRPVAELTRMALADLAAPEDRDRVAGSLAVNAETVIEHALIRRDGARLEVEARGRPVGRGSGHRYTAIRDITDHKRSQARAARLTTLYAVLSRVNEAIVRIDDEQDLFREICRIVAEEGRFELVWIGEVEGRVVVPRAASGPEVAYLEEIRIETDGPLGGGPTGTVIRKGEPAVNNDFLSDPAMAPWRDVAIRHGLRTSAAFPLRCQETTIGALTIYSSTSNRFDEEEVRLLTALAADLSYALDAMSQEKLRAETLERIRQSEEDRKVAEAVRAERQRLFAVLESLPAMVGLITPDYSVTFANRGFRDRFGESRGRRCFEYCYGRTEPCEFCESHGVLRTGRPHRWEIVAPDGVVLSVFASPFTDADGSPLVLEMILDVTESRRAESAVRQAHEHLAQRAAQLRALARELTVSAQRERQHLARILHDQMQQLLIAAKYRAAGLGQGGVRDTRETALEIERLLDMCIAEGRALTAELTPPTLKAGSLSADLAWLAHRMADRYGFRVDLDIDPDLPPLAEDVRVLLFESVRELLFNAVKHADVDRASLLVQGMAANRIRIVVRDDGKGFEPEGLKPAGDPSGGFGLFSIRERLDLLGGTMEITSSPGRGSQFTLVVEAGFPASGDGDSPDRSAAPVPDDARMTRPSRGATIRVLLADDHAVVREGLRQLLSREDDIEVVGEATDGQEAADLAEALRPDVVLMDLSMPRLDGIEATRAIHRGQPNIRIIGLSMFEDGPHVKDMTDAGAIDYFNKGVPPDTLVRAVRRAGLDARLASGRQAEAGEPAAR